MNKRQLIFFVIALLISLLSCNNYLPGYDFALFKNTSAKDLARAVELNDTGWINEILDKDPKLVNYQEKKFGNTLLMLSVVNNKTLSTEALLKHGADPFIVDNYHNNTMYLSCGYLNTSKCDTKKIDLLIKYGGSFKKEDALKKCKQGKYPKYNYVTESITVCFNVFKKVINYGGDINEYYKRFHERPVYYALLYEKFETAKYLIIEKKAEIPKVFSIGYYNEKPNQKVNVFEFIEKTNFNSTDYNPKLLKELVEYLTNHPEQFVSAPDSLVKLRLE